MVGIIILNYNNWEDTINCIDSVEEYNTAEIKYIVVDNGSTREGAVEALDNYLSGEFSSRYRTYTTIKDEASRLPYVSLLISPTNDGYAAGNNKGLKLAFQDSEIDHIMILNNDILFIQDIIPVLLKQANNIPDCGIISPLLFSRDKESIDYNCARKSVNPWVLIHAYLFFYRDVFGVQSRDAMRRLILKSNPIRIKEKSIEIELPSGSCMLMNKSLIEDMKGFDPHTFLYYEEDILYKRIKNKNLKNYLIPECECIHLGACSTSKAPSAFALTKQFESSIYYLENYCNLSVVQKVLLAIGKVLFRIKLYAVKVSK